MISMDINSQAATTALKRQSAAGKKAMLRTLNELAKAGRTEASREIKKTYNVKSAPVKKAIELIKAKPGRLVAIIRAAGRRIPLIEFSGREGKRGVTVKIKKATGTIRVPGAFIAVSRFAGRTIFERAGAARLPIIPQTGPSIVQMFKNRDVINRVRNRIARDAAKIFRRQYNFIKSKEK